MRKSLGSLTLFIRRSLFLKTTLLFFLILLIVVVPLAVHFYQVSRDYEIKLIAWKLEFFAGRGASWLNPEEIDRLKQPEDMRTQGYRVLVRALSRIEREFGVDNAFVLRRTDDGSFVYVANGNNAFTNKKKGLGATRNPCSALRNPCSSNPGQETIFNIGRPVLIHKNFPATFKATNDTWNLGRTTRSQIFGGQMGAQAFDQFLQINTPIKLNGRVIAILMLNKYANPVVNAVRTKIIKLVGLTAAMLAVGLLFVCIFSRHLLKPLYSLLEAAGKASRGELDVALPSPHREDEVGRLSAHIGGILSNMTELKQMQEELDRLAHHDPLTGLPNRVRLNERITHAAALIKRGGGNMAFLYIDLDGFKPINDTYGHEAGDFVLTEVGQRLKSCVREIDTVARLGGDEFAILMEPETDRDRAGKTAHRVLAALSAPIPIHGRECKVGASIGIGLFPADANDVEELIKAADSAMYLAKQNGRNTYRFSSR